MKWTCSIFLFQSRNINSVKWKKKENQTKICEREKTSLNTNQFMLYPLDRGDTNDSLLYRIIQANPYAIYARTFGSISFGTVGAPSVKLRDVTYITHRQRENSHTPTLSSSYTRPADAEESESESLFHRQQWHTGKFICSFNYCMCVKVSWAGLIYRCVWFSSVNRIVGFSCVDERFAHTYK